MEDTLIVFTSDPLAIISAITGLGKKSFMKRAFAFPSSFMIRAQKQTSLEVLLITGLSSP